VICFPNSESGFIARSDIVSADHRHPRSHHASMGLFWSLALRRSRMSLPISMEHSKSLRSMAPNPSRAAGKCSHPTSLSCNGTRSVEPTRMPWKFDASSPGKGPGRFMSCYGARATGHDWKKASGLSATVTTSWSSSIATSGWRSLTKWSDRQAWKFTTTTNVRTV
jgi:hypothetical protein